MLNLGRRRREREPNKPESPRKQKLNLKEPDLRRLALQIFIELNALILDIFLKFFKSFVDRAQLRDDRPVVHKHRKRPAHLAKGIYDLHHHAQSYSARENARTHRDERDDDHALTEHISPDIKVTVVQK